MKFDGKNIEKRPESQCANFKPGKDLGWGRTVERCPEGERSKCRSFPWRVVAVGVPVQDKTFVDYYKSARTVLKAWGRIRRRRKIRRDRENLCGVL